MPKAAILQASLLATLISQLALAAPPRKISELISTADLQVEIAMKIEELGPLVESADAFVENKKRIRQSASMLVVAAQALAEHDDESDFKPSAPDLREAGIKIALAEAHADAADGLQEAQAAHRGESSKSAPVEYDWAKLVKQRPIMEDNEAKMQQLQRALRRPKDPAAESRIAALLAVSSLPAIVDTHEVKDKSQLPEWDRLAKLMVDQLAEVTTAIKDKDAMKAQSIFKMSRTTCVECHRQFKKEN